MYEKVFSRLTWGMPTLATTGFQVPGHVHQKLVNADFRQPHLRASSGDVRFEQALQTVLSFERATHATGDVRNFDIYEYTCNGVHA